MRDQLFEEETTIQYCKILYGYDVVNAFGKFPHEMAEPRFYFLSGNLCGQEYKESWMWFVEPHLKVGFSLSVIRDLKLNDILDI